MLQLGLNPLPIHIPESKKVLDHNVHKGLHDRLQFVMAEQSFANKLINHLFNLLIFSAKINKLIKQNGKNGGFSTIKIRINFKKAWLQLLSN